MSGPREITPEGAALIARQIEQLARNLALYTRFFTGKQRLMLQSIAGLADQLARIADGKAGKHDHQRV